MKKNEIYWLSCLQGFSMLTVVVGHVYDHSNWVYGIYEKYLQDFIYIFHMPLFMFISGYLFNLTKISNNTSYKTVIKEKVVRLLIPYFAFNLITFVLKLLFPRIMNRTVDFSFNQFVQAFITLTNMPLYEMWFINVLFFFMVLYPLYCKILQKNVLSIVFSIITLISLFFPINFAFIFDFNKICKYIVYFWFGILTYQYKDTIKKINNLHFSIVITLLFIAQYIIGLHYSHRLMQLIAPIISIIFFVQLFYKIGKKTPNLFSSFRNYTYQIFLVGIFIQVFVRVTIFQFFERNIISTLMLYLFSISLLESGGNRHLESGRINQF